MHRVQVLTGHLNGNKVNVDATGVHATSAEATNVHVYPPGKKHFVTNPWERLARYEGDGTKNGGTKAATIPQAFKIRVQTVGDKNVLAAKKGARDGPWTKWTWKQYYAEVRNVAKALMALGCKHHEAVNVLAFNSPEWFFVAMGGVFAGTTPAGIYITNNGPSCEYIINHSKAKVVFVDNDGQLQKILSVRTNCPTLTAIVHWGPDCPKDGSVPGLMSWGAFVALASKVSDKELDARIDSMLPDSACYLSYTSGTTGPPKAVMYSHDNVLWGMKYLFKVVTTNAVNFGLDEREISYMPLSHIAGNLQLLGAICLPPNHNSEVYFAFPDAMAGSLPGTIMEVRPTHFLGVPRVWEKLAVGLQANAAAKPELKKNSKAWKASIGLDQIKCATTGAAPIDPQLLEFYDSIMVDIFEVYGMTENTAYSHYSKRGQRKIGSVGPALTDENSGAKLAKGSKEICTWSRGVMMGYMYNPQKSLETFDEEGFLRTGDVGEVKDGFTFITGRIKEMLITGGGENVAPVVLELVIKERLPALSNVTMVGDKQKYLIALLTLKLEPDGKGGFLDKLAPEAKAVDPTCTTFADVEKSKVWKAYLDKGIEDANKVAISRVQWTRKYKLIPGDFSPVVGPMPELTPTMKLKRDVVMKKYENEIKATYGPEDFISF